MAGIKESAGGTDGGAGFGRRKEARASDDTVPPQAVSGAVGPWAEKRELSPSDVTHRVALALNLMEHGDLDGARNQLAQILASDPEPHDAENPLTQPSTDPSPALTGRGRTSERPQAEEQLGASQSERALPEGASRAGFSEERPVEAASVRGSTGDFRLDRSPAFTTQTMAGLLDRQGDHARADGIREKLDKETQAREVGSVDRPAPTNRPAGARVLETLDSWLRNVKRERG